MIRFVPFDNLPLHSIAVCHPAIGPLAVVLDSRDAVVRVEWEMAPDVASVSDNAISWELARLFKGEDADIVVSPRGVTDMQLSVLRAIACLPFGSVSSYSALAETAGFPHAVRAVATAVGRNPIPVVLPCHRVLPVAAAGLWQRSPLKLFEKPSLLGHYTPDDALKSRLLQYEFNLKKP